MLGMMEARPQAGALDGVAGESKKQVLAHMTLPCAFSHRTLLHFHARIRGRCCGGVLSCLHHQRPRGGYVVRPTSFWHGPKGLGYHHPLPSASFPAPLRHCSPVLFPHLSLGRQGENWDAWISLFLALFIKNKLVQEPALGASRNGSLKIVLTTAAKNDRNPRA